MTKHALKIDEQWFDAVAAGTKNFEVRKNDRDFKVGDTLLIEEWDSKVVDKGEGYESQFGPRGYTGRKAVATITFILRAEEFPIAIKEGYAVLGIKILETRGFLFTD